MASATRVTANYTSLSDIKKYWLENIAPKYFDLEDTNTYNVGIFGYVNEVMGNTAEDSFNATAVARREFYPVTAQFTSSLYAMATLQSLDIPLTTPATCKLILIVPQKDILNNSTFSNGVWECTIDDCLKIFVGDLQFMLDYPIKIISKFTDKWIHTIHYDVSVSNSLNTTPDSRYISNAVLVQNSDTYVAMFIPCIRQLEREEISKTVVKDSILDTVTMDIDFSGNLANFEIFYKENSTSQEQQLTKVMINAPTPSTPYAKYEIINNNKIRLTFEYNTIFVPRYGSEIICRVYTSQGKDGNFHAFNEDVVCSSDSEAYPYNANMTFVGRINGEATGGKNQITIDEFRNSVLKAYTTNKTITTSKDLQLHFDTIAESILNTKVLFRKKRDDPMIRLFGAYAVFKDDAENVIPTNTLDMEVEKDDFNPDGLTALTRITIPPGTIFEYKAGSSSTVVPTKNASNQLATPLDIQKNGDPNKMYFTNPFMMGINISPNNIGYYMNSMNKTCSVEFTYVNDESAMQFVNNSVNIYRNTVAGSDYYRLSAVITPPALGDLDKDFIFVAPDETAADYEIRAPYSGRVLKEELYFDTTINQSYVRYTIEYNTTDPTQQIAYIQGSNTLPIGTTSVTGYKMKYEVGDNFLAGSVLATKRITDKGNLVIIGDLSSALYPTNHYFAFSLQEFNEEHEWYTLEAYISTTDEIDMSEKLTINHGIYRSTGEEHTLVALSMKQQRIEMNILFNNDGANIPNKYTTFAGLANYTLTNTYTSNENDLVDLIDNLPFIRSVTDSAPIAGGGGTNFRIKVSEVPLIGALWSMEGDNYEFFIEKYTSVNDGLNQAYYNLENNFSIDSKFYNTYGKSQFFTVGNTLENMVPLDSVRCKFHFGVRLNTISSSEQFVSRFRQFVQSYVEDNSRITDVGQDLYILNLISAIKTEFEEIAYLEYYGMNTYDHTAQKVLGPSLDAYEEGFIPEFLNLEILYDANGNMYPNVRVDILD